ncbi:hypothetical protein Hanom_Chr14g01326931 [Helianthus anomalus]
MYIPKNFYTKTTYSPLLSEKFGGSTAPSRPLKASPMHIAYRFIYVLLSPYRVYA